MKKRVVFKHYKTGKPLTVEGLLPPELNNPQSDRYIIQAGLVFVDVIKSTVISIEDIP